MVVWLASLGVIQQKGWAWLPVASTLASLYLLNRVERQITQSFLHWSDLLIFLGGLTLLLFLSSRLNVLTLRVVVATLLLPLVFSVTFYVVVNAVIGSIG